MLLFVVSGMCYAEDITVKFDGNKAKVKNHVKDSVSVTVDGAYVSITSLYKKHVLTLRLSGKSDDGQLVLKTEGKAKVILDRLTLTSSEGAPLCLKNKKKVEVNVVNGTENSLTITACNDTINHKAAVIWAKDKLLLSGKGTLNLIATGDGCRGVKSKKDITIEELTLYVTTTGNNLGEKPFGFGGFSFPDFNGEMPDFSAFPGFGNDSTMRGVFPGPPGGFPPFSNDSTRRGEMSDFRGFPGPPPGFPPFGNDSTLQAGFPGPPGGFPPFGNDTTHRGGMPGFGGFPGPSGGFHPFSDDAEDGDGSPGGFGGKRKYVASTKGIASKGKVIINSGCVTVRTSTPGAEGIEGKNGVVFNGGFIDVLSPDDAVNANATIEFNNAEVIVRSKGNDAVDANPKGGFFPMFGGENNQNIEPGIIIRGGTVYAFSQVGPPEEGLDSDFAPLLIEGGTVFTVGGSIGDTPSVPDNNTARQPTVLLAGMNFVKDEPVNIYDADQHLIHTLKVPFSCHGSATVVTCPAFKLSSTYTVKTKGVEKTFTFNQPFIIVR